MKTIIRENFINYSEDYRLIWKIQSIIFKNIFYYYDNDKKEYCREVKNVKCSFDGNWIIAKTKLIKLYGYNIHCKNHKKCIICGDHEDLVEEENKIYCFSCSVKKERAELYA